MPKYGFAALFFAAATAIFAQVERASIIGNVTDATGAVAPGVTVTVTNEATNTSVSLTTDDRAPPESRPTHRAEKECRGPSQPRAPRAASPRNISAASPPRRNQEGLDEIVDYGDDEAPEDHEDAPAHLAAVEGPQRRGDPDQRRTDADGGGDE